jgi:hypothetical protein
MRYPVVVGFAVLAAGAASAAGQGSSFPLEPGLTWTYRGYVSWTGSNGQVHGDSVTWTTTIIAVRTGPNARAALVRGWVQDLAWHEPTKKATYSALMLRRGRLYRVAAQDSADAAEVMESAVGAGASPPDLSNLVLDSALVVEAVYGRDSVTSKRDDNLYGWYVASDRVIAAPTRWKAAKTRVRRVTLEYRSQPDYQRIDFVPGVGITRFVYSHHGTVAEADVRLVSVKR